VSVHGKTVADSETRVLHLLPSALVVRSGPLFGPWDGETFVSAALRTLATGRPFVAADDVVVSPTYLPDLIQAALDVLIDGEQGVWHLATPGSTTWADLARHAARQVGLDADLVIGRPARRLGLPATTPPYSVLGSERGTLLPPLDDALSRYHAQCDHLWTRGSRTARFEPDLPRRRSPRTA
jgi:dTDP-4-dehydrorhamnose reductase